MLVDNGTSSVGDETLPVVDVGAKYRAAFDQCWRIMRDHWYDDRLGNRNWDEVGRKYRDAAGRTTDDLTFSTIVAMMLGELNGSHLGFTPSGESDGAAGDDWRPTTGHLGVRFDPRHKGPGLKIHDVLPRGPADADGQARRYDERGIPQVLAAEATALTVDEAHKRFVCNVTKESLEQMPGFDKHHWPDLNDLEYATGVYRQWGATPYWT